MTWPRRLERKERERDSPHTPKENFHLGSKTESEFHFNFISFRLISSAFLTRARIPTLVKARPLLTLASSTGSVDNMKGGKPKSQAKNAALSVNKKAAAVSKGRQSTKKDKQAKDPNKPKRPPSAFFVFMEEFRVQYKEKHPQNKAVSVVGKAGGDKWKSLSDAEKAPYIAKAEKRKADYEKSMKAYNKKQAEGAKADEEDSEKSSEVNNEDEDDEDDDDEDDDDE